MLRRFREYSLEDNPSTVTSRTARIEFVCGEKTAVVELVQKPKETVIANLSLVPGELKVQAGTECTVKALVLPEDTPRGLVTVCFQGHPLGLVKNIGTRANNLYPKEWKIKTTHIPQDYEAILRHTESNTD